MKLKTAKESVITESCCKIHCAGIMWQEKGFPMVHESDDPLHLGEVKLTLKQATGVLFPSCKGRSRVTSIRRCLQPQKDGLLKYV